METFNLCGQKDEWLFCGDYPVAVLVEIVVGVACGPGFPLIRLQALRSGPVSAPIPNTFLK
ncbi:hypothetical protein EPL05_20825 [Mucilaginibacter gilvus]|uniref:Uncharacterized protein n=1 Tax=Mucilaginibacter gilvus TaxID=2305909 RepID=A0A3S3X0R4_9SPHI|nr:hypothetical protein EPL05_20825 [Mucilaginibacter gilvus]